MSSATLNLTIASTLQKQGFTEAAEQMRIMQKELERTTKSVQENKSAFDTLKELLPTIGLVEFLKMSVEESIKAEEAQRRLQIQVTSAGMSWEKNKGQLNSYIETLSTASRFSREELVNALGQLIQRTHDVAMSQRDLQLAMNISVGSGKSLEEITVLIGMAAEGNSRGLLKLARDYGIQNAAAMSADQILQALNKTFKDTAFTEEGMAKSTKAFWNSFKEMSEGIGNAIGTVFKPWLDFGTKLMRVFGGVFETFAATLPKLKAILHGGGKAAVDELAKTFDEGMDKVLAIVRDKGEKITLPKGKLAGDTERDIKELMKALDELQKKTNEAMVKSVADEETQIQQTVANTIKELMKLPGAYEHVQQIITAAMAHGEALRLVMEKKTGEDRIKLAIQVGNTIGVATGQMLMGQQDAWKKAANSIIDMMVTQAQAAILINAEAAYAVEVGHQGFAGIVSALPLLAWGAAKAAGVAAIGEVAKAALGTGGGVSASGGSGSGGGASATTTSVSAPAAASNNGTAMGGGGVTVIIQGNVVGTDQETDSLIRRISDAVQTRDVQLIATQARG